MYIETGRMVIRDFTMDDLYDLHGILGDAETMKYCEPAYTIQETADFLQAFCIDKKGAVAAVHKEIAQVIGYILLNGSSRDVYEIGWIFNKAYWRNGFAFESCKAVIDHAFDSMNAREIVAETIDEMRSVHLMKKLGMQLKEIQKRQVEDLFGNRVDRHIYSIIH